MAHAFLQLNRWAVLGGVIAGPRAGGDVDELAPAGFEWFDAGHPAPNAASVRAADTALRLAQRARVEPDKRLIVLLSGGASAMMAAPAAGITLDDKITVARRLMNAGLAIDALNCVRKHLSDVKGGRLAAAAGPTSTLAISDVHSPVPDDPSVIGSGPTVPDPTTFSDALAIIDAVDGVPGSVRDRFQRGAAGLIEDTPKPEDPRFAHDSYRVIGNRQTALAGARVMAESLGYRVVVLDRVTDGEARLAARRFVEESTRVIDGATGPLCVLAAGETTVTVQGPGKGGRNQEFALAAAPLVSTLTDRFGRDIAIASAGTDGADGPTDAAGAIVDRTTLERAARSNLDWKSTLERNDAYYFFQPLGDLIMWGPTGTNVGDVQLLLTA